MSETFSLTCGHDTVVLPRPEYGYEVEIHFPVSQAKAADGSRSFFCNAPPYRVLSASSFIMNPTDKRDLDDFLRLTARGETIELALGSIATGFFPFGPDLGDKGTFTCCLTQQTPSGQLFAPFGWFKDDYHFVMVSHPSYSYGASRRQGDFALSIGELDVTNLPYPNDGFNVTNSYSYETFLSKTGVPSTWNGRSSADNYVSEFELSLYQVNAAKLVSAISQTLGKFERYAMPPFVIHDCGYYVFGVNNGKKGKYSCQFLGSSDDGAGSEIVLKVTHESYDCFKVPLAFLLATTDLDYEFVCPLTSSGDGAMQFTFPIEIINPNNDYVYDFSQQFFTVTGE